MTAARSTQNMDHVLSDFHVLIDHTDWYVKWFGASQSPKQAGRNQKMADLQERQLENRGRKQVLGGAELLFEIHHFHCAKKTWTPMTRDHVIEVFMTRNKLLKNSVTGNVERDRH